MKTNVAGRSLPLCDPKEIAHAAVREFRSRSYLQRHSGVKRLTLPTLVMELVAAGALLRLSVSSFAGDYLVSAQIEQKGKVVSNPTVLVEANKEATVSIKDGASEYVLTVKAGDETDKAVHTVEMQVLTTDSTGKKSTWMAPRVSVNSAKKATVEVGDFKFSVEVDVRAAAKDK